MILENNIIRLTIDPVNGAVLTGMAFKPLNLEILSTAQPLKTESGIHAVFNDMAFGSTGESDDAAGDSATLSATSNSLKLTKRFSIIKDVPGFQLTETLENLGTHEREVLWGQRFILGPAWIDSHVQIETSATSYFDPSEEPILRMRWPKLVDGTDLSNTRCGPGRERTYYLSDFTEGVCRAVSPARGMGIEIGWDAQLFPYCWLRESDGMLSMLPFTGLPDAMEEGHGTLNLPVGAKIDASYSFGVIKLKH